MLKIYIIAGEASGDNIGAKLMQQIKAQHTEVQFYGIGGNKMQKQGINLLFSSHELSIMGFFEVLKHLPKMLKRLKDTRNDIIDVQPDALITIDAPGFCFRVAKAVKNKIKAKLVHYVAPTVWAYRPGRAKKIAQIYDKLLTILPFETEYFEKEGLDTVFVGYPPIEDVEKGTKEFFRYKNKLPKGNLLLCVAPGSRAQEVKKLLPTFLKATEMLATHLKNALTIAIPCASEMENLISKYIQDKDNIILVKDNDKKELFSAADIAIAKSGTITTELGLYGVPMVVAYKTSWFSYLIIKMLIKVRFVSIINILLGYKVIPELLQKDCTPKKIFTEIELLLSAEHREAQLRGVSRALEMLLENDKSPSEMAADEILKIL